MTSDAIYSNRHIHRFLLDQGSHVDPVIPCFHLLRPLLGYRLIQLFPTSVIKQNYDKDNQSEGVYYLQL